MSVNTLPDSRAPERPGRCLDAATDLERALGELLADVTKASRVSVNSHFFRDLDADSMRMAHFCARVRKQPGLPAISMKDVYKHSTIRSLARAIAPGPTGPRRPAVPPLPVVTPVSTLRYLTCGALQLLLFLGAVYLGALVVVHGFEWISAGVGWVNVYERALVFGLAGLVGHCVLPILAKWLLIGRWKPAQIRVWSPAYLRFWVVKVLIRTSPMVLFVGSPIYVAYLRALGAKIGRGVVIWSPHMPVCTDLLTIGSDTIIRKDSYFTCYRAQAGVITTGRVTLGNNVLVGEASVLDINTWMCTGSQLGHSSALHPGQTVPPNQRWHGCPARPGKANYRTLPAIHRIALRRFLYCTWQVLRLVAFGPPMLGAAVTGIEVVLGSGFAPVRPDLLSVSGATFYAEVLVVSVLGFFSAILFGLLWVAVVPRILNRFLSPDRVYPLYGIHFWLHRAITRMTNVRFFTHLFGDSSYIVNYLRWIGYDLCHVVQSGSNFGSEVKQDNPYLSRVGSGTMVADGLSVINADYSTTSFRVRQVSIGPENFLGNHVAYPYGARTGANCLLATKVAVPVDGPTRHGVGLLGAPAFEIPRSVERDSRFDHLSTGEALRTRLRAKDLHNQATMALYLLVRLVYFLALTALAALTADLYRPHGAPVVAVAGIAAVVFTTLYFALVERAGARFRGMRPRFCSIYDLEFWRHERYWKFTMFNHEALYNGTPFKGLVWRLCGARVGRRLFDDGASISEKPLTSIGDDCTLNQQSKIQAHSQEDGAFKSDYITIGNGCTVGLNALVHYGTEMGRDSVLETDGFLMKGEQTTPRTRWIGNPAIELR